MSTRAMYTFIEPEHTDNKRGYHVYKHHDGYPSGAAQWIENALPHAWQGGRFEADEFAAAFVAGNKSHYINRELELLRQIETLSATIATETVGHGALDQLRKELVTVRQHGSNTGGGVRLMHSGSVYAVAPDDIEWRYEITSKKGKLQVACYATSFFETRTKANEHLYFKGTCEAFKAWALEGEGK